METVYMQQWQKHAKTRTKVSPCTQLWEDLTNFIQLARASQEGVLLMLDANADVNDTGFSTFPLDCGLHDLHNDISIDLPPETYYRGTQKTDFCLGTQGVASAVVQAGITAYEDGFKYSDHRALLVDLNEDALFSSQGANPTSWHGRGLHIKNKMAMQRYRDLFCKKLLSHNILERCQQLTKHPVGCNPIGLKSEIEAIDAEITRAALQAERSTAEKKALAMHGLQLLQKQVSRSPSGEIAFGLQNPIRTHFFI